MKTSLLKSISFVAFLAVATPVNAADPVVAKVDGKTFTYSQVMEAKSALPKQYQAAPEEKIYPVLLNQIVDTYLIEKAATSAGLENKPEVKKAIEKATDGTKNEGGDLGFFRKSELPKELAESAFALTPGSYSQTPIKTDFGWHVIMVDQVRDAVPPKLDEIKNELKGLMTQEAVVALVKDLRSKAKIELFDKDGKPMPLEAEKPAAATPASTETPVPAPKK